MSGRPRLPPVDDRTLASILHSLPICKRKDLAQVVPTVRQVNRTTPYRLRRVLVSLEKNNRSIFYVHMDFFHFGLAHSSTSYPGYQNDDGTENVRKLRRFLAFHLRRGRFTCIDELIDTLPFSAFDYPLMIRTLRLDHSATLKPYLNKCPIHTVMIRDTAHAEPLHLRNLVTRGVRNAKVLDIKTKKIEIPILAMATWQATKWHIADPLTSTVRLGWIFRKFASLDASSDYTGATCAGFRFTVFERIIISKSKHFHIHNFLYNTPYFTIPVQRATKQLIACMLPRQNRMVIKVAPTGESIFFVLNA